MNLPGDAGSLVLPDVLLPGREATQGGTRRAQLLLGSSRLGHVARDPQERLDGARRVAERHRVSLQPPASPLQPNDLELERRGLAGEHTGVQVCERGPVFRGHELDHRVEPNRVDARRLDHRQAGGVHFQEPPLRIHQLHAVGLAVDDRAEAFLTVVTLGDIERESHDPNHAAVRPHHRLDPRGERATVEHRLVRDRLPAERGAVRRHHGRRL